MSSSTVSIACIRYECEITAGILVGRLKSFSFNEQDLTIEIPKPLQLADVAVRVVWPPLTHQLEKETVIDVASNDDTPGQEGDNIDVAEKSSTTVEPVDNAESSDKTTEVCVCLFVSVSVCWCF